MYGPHQPAITEPKSESAPSIHPTIMEFDSEDASDPTSHVSKPTQPQKSSLLDIHSALHPRPILYARRPSSSIYSRPTGDGPRRVSGSILLTTEPSSLHLAPTVSQGLQQQDNRQLQGYARSIGGTSWIDDRIGSDHDSPDIPAPLRIRKAEGETVDEKPPVPALPERYVSEYTGLRDQGESISEVLAEGRDLANSVRKSPDRQRMRE